MRKCSTTLTSCCCSVAKSWMNWCDPWSAASQAPLSFPISQSLLKFMSFELGFPGDSDSKESACNVGDSGLISGSGRSPGEGSGRSPGEGNGYAIQYSCLENSMDRGAWQLHLRQIKYFSFSISLSIIPSRSIHVLANGRILLLFVVE